MLLTDFTYFFQSEITVSLFSRFRLITVSAYRFLQLYNNTFHDTVKSIIVKKSSQLANFVIIKYN